MIVASLVWMVLPFFIGFSIYLLPQADRILAFGVTLVSCAYAIGIFLQPASIDLHLLDSFGVTLLVDDLSAFCSHQRAGNGSGDSLLLAE